MTDVSFVDQALRVFAAQTASAPPAFRRGAFRSAAAMSSQSEQ
ncbi:hypothetical protein [Streptomyces sp. NPDC054804]